MRKLVFIIVLIAFGFFLLPISTLSLIDKIVQYNSACKTEGIVQNVWLEQSSRSGTIVKKECTMLHPKMRKLFIGVDIHKRTHGLHMKVLIAGSRFYSD